MAARARRGGGAAGRLSRPKPSTDPARRASEMRTVVLIISIVFIAGLGALTGLDVSRYGLTPLDLVAILIIALMAVGILGALRPRPPGR